jgi:hypothetical protein
MQRQYKVREPALSTPRPTDVNQFYVAREKGTVPAIAAGPGPLGRRRVSVRYLQRAILLILPPKITVDQVAKLLERIDLGATLEEGDFTLGMQRPRSNARTVTPTEHTFVQMALRLRDEAMPPYCLSGFRGRSDACIL